MFVKHCRRCYKKILFFFFQNRPIVVLFKVYGSFNAYRISVHVLVMWISTIFFPILSYLSRKNKLVDNGRVWLFVLSFSIMITLRKFNISKFGMNILNTYSGSYNCIVRLTLFKKRKSVKVFHFYSRKWWETIPGPV